VPSSSRSIVMIGPSSRRMKILPSGDEWSATMAVTAAKLN